MTGRRSLLGSAALFLVLAVAAWWVLRGEAPEEPERFFGLARMTPDTLTVVVPPDSTVLVPGGEGGWRLLHPVRDDADPLVVEALLKRLRDLPVDRRFPLTPPLPLWLLTACETTC